MKDFEISTSSDANDRRASRVLCAMAVIPFGSRTIAQGPKVKFRRGKPPSVFVCIWR